MDIKKELDRKIEKKRQEIADLEKQLAEGRAYLQALEDTMKLLPKDSVINRQFVLRTGSVLAKVQEVLKKRGSPLHIEDILKQIGQPNDKKQKLSLSGSLATYARDGKVFTRGPAPNTFGLIDFENGGPPEDFGLNETNGESAELL
jgi:hypothetical protein